MLNIIDDKIYLVRGDDETLTVELTSGEEEVTLADTETLTLTVRKLPASDSPVVFSSTSEAGSNQIVIAHADTEEAEYGEYSADIQLLTATGKRKTVWPVVDADNIPKAAAKNLKNFIILPEVTMT